MIPYETEHLRFSPMEIDGVPGSTWSVERRGGHHVGTLNLDLHCFPGLSFWNNGWSRLTIEVMRASLEIGRLTNIPFGLGFSELGELVQAWDHLFVAHQCQIVLAHHGQHFAYEDLDIEERRYFPAPRYQAGDLVVVVNPWWRPRVPQLRCRVEESHGLWCEKTGYLISVREEANPGSHARDVHESDVAGHVLFPEAVAA